MVCSDLRNEEVVVLLVDRGIAVSAYGASSTDSSLRIDVRTIACEYVGQVVGCSSSIVG